MTSRFEEPKHMPVVIRCPTQDTARLPELCALLGIRVPATAKERVVVSDLLRVIFDVDDETWWANRPADWELMQQIQATYNA
jgi:hypothetical protein